MKKLRITIDYRSLRDLFTRIDVLEDDQEAHRYKVDELKRDHDKQLEGFAARIKATQDELKLVTKERDQLLLAREANDRMAFQKGYDHGVASVHMAGKPDPTKALGGRLVRSTREKRVRVGKVP